MSIQLIPNAKRTEIIGEHDGALKIRLQALPVDGKANDALIRYVAERLGVPKGAVQITHGHTSRSKVVQVSDDRLTIEAVAQALAPTAA